MWSILVSLVHRRDLFFWITLKLTSQNSFKTNLLSSFSSQYDLLPNLQGRTILLIQFLYGLQFWTTAYVTPSLSNMISPSGPVMRRCGVKMVAITVLLSPIFLLLLFIHFNFIFLELSALMSILSCARRLPQFI
jgi:hypothetical protein